MTHPGLTFIGWHNSGKTTVLSQVIHHLKAQGYTLGVIKSTKERNISWDQPGTDTAIHTQAGADQVMLMTPERMLLHGPRPQLTFQEICLRFFSHTDLVLGEGFKHDPSVEKIQVCRFSDNLLSETVAGVIATVSDLPQEELPDLPTFSPSQPEAISVFVQERVQKILSSHSP